MESKINNQRDCEKWLDPRCHGYKTTRYPARNGHELHFIILQIVSPVWLNLFVPTSISRVEPWLVRIVIRTTSKTTNIVGPERTNDVEFIFRFWHNNSKFFTTSHLPTANEIAGLFTTLAYTRAYTHWSGGESFLPSPPPTFPRRAPMKTHTVDQRWNCQGNSHFFFNDTERPSGIMHRPQQSDCQ